MTVQVAIGSLDEQLLLTASQRKELTAICHDLIKKNPIPPSANLNVYSSSSRFVFPLLSDVPDEKLNDMFSKSQVDAWKDFVGRYARLRGGVFQNRAIQVLPAVPLQRAVPAVPLQRPAPRR